MQYCSTNCKHLIYLKGEQILYLKSDCVVFVFLLLYHTVSTYFINLETIWNMEIPSSKGVILFSIFTHSVYPIQVLLKHALMLLKNGIASGKYIQ